MEKSTRKRVVLRKTLSLREAERALTIENGSFWKDFVETLKIPVINLGKDKMKPKWRVRIEAIDEYLRDNEGFPERSYDSN